MRWLNKSSILIVTLTAAVSILTACAGLSKQSKATTDGISIEYKVAQKTSELAQLILTVKVDDARANKEILGRGAQNNLGRDIAGYLVFGVIYAFAPSEPYINDKESLDDVVYDGVFHRFSNMGAQVSKATIAEKGAEDSSLHLDIKIKVFNLDFNWGKWLGIMKFDYAFAKNGKFICERSISEKSTVFNMYGFGSGEEAINEVFNKAINGIQVCL